MPEYKITLKDGRTVTLRAPSRPTEEQVMAAIDSGGVRNVSGGSGPTLSATPESKPPTVTGYLSNVANYVQKHPEETIEMVAPAAGATIGGLVAGPPGAVTGATAGWAYGKANRAASNAATGKPIGTDMPKTLGDWGWDLAGDVALNSGPDVAIPGIANFLKARGVGLVSRAMRPSQSTVNHMVEMGQRGALPMDVRAKGAQTLIDTANKHGNLAPVSDKNIRSAVGDMWKAHDDVTDVVRAGADAGDTVAMGPITGEAGGYAVHSVRGKGGIGGSPTPSDKLPAVRNRIKAYQSDPESTLTAPTTVYKPDVATPVSPETSVRIDFPNSELLTTAEREGITETLKPRGGPFKRNVPNPEANPLDLLEKRRYLGGDLRGSYGVNPDNANATIVDKAWYRATGDELKSMYPEVASNLQAEHELMNAIGMALPQEYLTSQANPLNLYTFLGAASGQPEALALGISNYPWAKSALGKGLHNLGARMGGERAGAIMRFKTLPETTASLYRAALRSRMGFTPD